MDSKRTYLRGIFAVMLALAAVGLLLRVRWKPPDAVPVHTETPIAPVISNAFASTPTAVIPATFAEVAKALDPVVVSIFTTQTIRAPYMGPQDEFLRRFFGMPDQKQTSLGSGFLIDPDGYILTNYHVVSQADDIRVQFTDKNQFHAKTVGKDSLLDLALIKIENPPRKFASASLGDSDALQVGDWVVAVGNPFGLGGTVTAGIVSAKGRMIHQDTRSYNPYEDFIQTDASINPGNSGGPLVNIHGEVVGINSVIFSPTGGNIGIGFAIPINLAKKILTQLKTQGKVTRAWLGIGLDQVSPELAENYGLSEARGALVRQVLPDSPAAKSGLKEGDIIIEIDGKTISDPNELMRMVSLSPIGSNVTLTFLRGGKQMKLSVTLAEKPGEKELAMMGSHAQMGIKSDLLGLTVTSLSPEQAQQANLPPGVVVVEVAGDGPAAANGIAAGDVIVKLNGETIKTLDDFQKVASGLRHGQIVKLVVLRGGSRMFLAFRIP